MLKTFNQFTKILNEAADAVIDISSESDYGRKGEDLPSNNFFIIHHTGGRGTASGVVDILNSRGKLGIQWVVDRDGTIYKTLPSNSRGAHVLPSNDFRGAPPGISNSNAQGVEVIANNDADILMPEQGIAVLKIIKHLGYTKNQVFGHGEVNPGHKSATEGATIKQYVMDHFDDPIDLSVFNNETTVDKAQPVSGNNEKVAVIDSDLIKRLVAKLKEKNFSQAELDAYSPSLAAGKGTNFKSNSKFPEENMNALLKAMDQNGITNEFARKAILGVISKESPNLKSEISYFGTSISRIREVYSSKLAQYTDTQIEGWKSQGPEVFDSLFWEAVYGGRYGNVSPGDGAKYRGRGFNGITFKGNYENLQRLYDKMGSKLGNINIVENPEELEKPEVAAEFAVIYFIDSFTRKGKDPNAYSDLDSAIQDYVQANAGWGSSLGSTVGREAIAKASAFANNLTTEVA